ncbi:hypothetical protein [Streptomyces sp. AC558_RSS880]|uniref:hypothetical protein n=1 Tax=Streptomyces sp. AC558_RSS880 TaxID=2823687 RepID=UPI0020B6A9A0|nr:hypothetical protein [Streptomyces sp. AC558_RSS880]
MTLQDTAVNELRGSSPVNTQAVGTHEHDHIRLCVGLRGATTLRDPHDRGGDAYVSAGTCFMHHVVTENHFHTTPGSGNRIFIFPGDALRSLVAGKPRAGQAASPAAQVLMAHTSMVQRTVSDLGPAATHASRNALIELAEGLVLDHFDDREPTFTPALAQAAKDLADARLADAGLSPATIAAHRHFTDSSHFVRAFKKQYRATPAQFARRPA